MVRSRRIQLGMATLALFGGALVGGSALRSSTAYAGDSHGEAKMAAKQARLAARALKRHALAEAVGRAEQAVLLAPGQGAYRALLGRAYLAAGRFASAAEALDSAVSLDAADGKTVLNLALAKIAVGEWADARRTLEMHAAAIQPADLGLAMALAGDPMGGVTVLGRAARDPTATAKTRQNLALALALAGKWPEARTIAALDLSAEDTDRRLLEWARFSHPARASDQVAAMLGVTAVDDGGMPVQLALQPRAEGVAIAQVPVPSAAYPAAEPEAPRVKVVFGERREIVQTLPMRSAEARRP